MAMDRAEKLGLGAAIGGHGLLLGAMALGLLMSAERLTKTEAISVSLVGEIADVSTAPDAIQEEPAPAAAGESEPVPQIFEAEPITRPIEKPLEREVTAPAKTAVKKVAVKQPPAKQPPKTKPSKPSTSPGFSKSFEDAVNAVGKAPGSGKAVGTPAAKTAAEVKRSVNAILGPQIRPHLKRCVQRGVDIELIETFVTVSLDQSGRLTGATYNKQTNVNDSNRPQAGVLKDCILQAVRAASPYEGLDPEYYDIWKSHALRLRATG